jgi:hypothetical protein
LAQTIEKALSFCGYDQLSANAIKSAHQFTRESLALKQVQFYRTWVQRKYSPIHQ